MKRLAALFALSLSLSGCFGSFNLTKSIHKWNHDVVHEKWEREAVFVGLVIVPVYEIALLGDALVTNAIEFFDGGTIDPGGD